MLYDSFFEYMYYEQNQFHELSEFFLTLHSWTLVFDLLNFDLLPQDLAWPL